MLKDKSNKARILSLISIYHAKSGHPGGVLSCIDILTYLFNEEMNYDSSNFSVKDRDRFILSKGHCAPALYAVASICGILDESRLNGLRKINHELQGHTCRTTTPWVEASTGSLSQGFSFATGEAMGLRMQKIDITVYVMIGDGEMQEGEIWEGAMFAAHHNLSNLCAILDYNKLQSDNTNANIMGLEPVYDKWQSFGWNVLEIDGHDEIQIKEAFNRARDSKDRPTFIIAHTIKGKGVSYMENIPEWHGSLKLSDEDLTGALTELGVSNDDIKAVIDGR